MGGAECVSRTDGSEICYDESTGQKTGEGGDDESFFLSHSEFQDGKKFTKEGLKIKSGDKTVEVLDTREDPGEDEWT